MTLATLAEVLEPAYEKGFAVGGLVCLGWEDMRAYATAAEAEGLPVILQAGPSCRAHTPLPVLGAMFRNLADSVSVPVVAHLDHGYTIEEAEGALEAGFTSLMFDGSKLPLDENIEATQRVVDLAHSAGVSCEGEIGFVGYAAGAASHGTDPNEAAIFARETGVDAMAISVGNVHLQENHEGELDRDRINEIEKATSVPLVIHGGSGVPPERRRELAHDTAISKFNIGTELRMAFGSALRDALANDPSRFDRVGIFKDVEPKLVEAARTILRGIGPV